jgi:hypothetical protein
MELMTRVEAVLRRGRSLLPAGDFDSHQFGDFKLMAATESGSRSA